MKTFREMIKETADLMVSADLSSKVVFDDVVKQLKSAKVVDSKGATNGLVEDTKKTLEEYPTNVVNRIVKAVTLAGKWYDKKMFTKHEVLYYYNIELALRVLDSLEEADSNTVRNKLNRVSFKDKTQYNNDFEAKLKEVMKEYSLVDVDGAIVSVEKRIEKLWNTMNNEQKAGFLKFISSNCVLHTKVEEVA